MGLKETKIEHDYAIENGAYRFRPKCYKTNTNQANNLLVYVYFINEKKFVLSNGDGKKLFKKDEDTFLKKGWDFWYSIIENRYIEEVKSKITAFLNPPFINNKLKLEYPIALCNGTQMHLKHEMLLHHFQHAYYAINFLALFPRVNTSGNFFFPPKQPESHNRTKDNSLVSISRRENEVLQLIADGYSSKEIATQLYISDHTVISHRKNLIEKFEVKNTAHLIKKAMQLMPLF